MAVKVNGVERELAGRPSLEDYLGQLGFRLDCVAVELNGEIVPKGGFGQVVVREGDTMEVVSFMGGG